jgi:hypothetical protein
MWGMGSSEGRKSRIPQVIGGFGSAVALVLFLALTLMFPAPLDWAFEQGGKAPMLIGIVGVAFMAGAYWAFERAATKMLQR